jgi:hypothetical protein
MKVATLFARLSIPILLLSSFSISYIRGFPFVFNFASSGIWFNVSAVFIYVQTDKFWGFLICLGARVVLASETSFLAFTLPLQCVSWCHFLYLKVFRCTVLLHTKVVPVLN